MSLSKKVTRSFRITESLLNSLDKEMLRILHCKNRSDFLEKAILFCEANRHDFIRAVIRADMFDQVFLKLSQEQRGVTEAPTEEDIEKIAEFFALNPFRIKDFGKPIRLEIHKK